MNKADTMQQPKLVRTLSTQHLEAAVEELVQGDLLKIRAGRQMSPYVTWTVIRETKDIKSPRRMFVVTETIVEGNVNQVITPLHIFNFDGKPYNC